MSKKQPEQPQTFTGTATCGDCGNTHTSTADTQGRADGYARNKATACARNDAIQRTYAEARRRKAAEEDELAERKRAEKERRRKK